MAELKQGSTLRGGKYKIVKSLGQGSFGITYLAQTRISMNGQLGKMDVNVNVTIKEFYMSDMNSRAADGYSVELTSSTLVKNYQVKFRREAENLAKLSHPNIVKVLEVFDENNTTYYVMEYIDGQNVDEHIKKNGKLTEQEALRITKATCSALSYMHGRKMLHLDLKPKNIMLNSEGQVFLIDFGLAKQYTEDGEPESSTSLGLGTPGYAPIEQAHYKQDGTFPVTLDIYALGASLYKMLTGKTPPDSSYVLNEGLSISGLKNAGVSDAVISIIEKAMAPLKKDRYQSVDSMSKALDDCNMDEDGTTIDMTDGFDEETQYKDDSTYDNNEQDKSLGDEVDKCENDDKTSCFKKHWKFELALLLTICMCVFCFWLYTSPSTKDAETRPTPAKKIVQNGNQPEGAIYPTFTDMRELKVGDYVYSDGSFSHEGPSNNKSCIGMVFSLKTTAAEKKKGWTHGQMVALKDAGDCAWSDDEVDFPSPHKNVVTQLWTNKMISEIRSDKDGYIYSTSRYTNNCPAFKAARNYNVVIPFASSGWYIPSIGQWCDILENICGFQLQREPKDYIEVMLIGKNKSNLKFDTSAFEYWSSSDRSKYYVWVYQPSGFESGGLTNGRKGMGGKVRTVAAF